VVPTLLSWPGSAVIHDIKGENWTLTAGWRSRFSHCLLFNPTDARSAAYNPLLEVRRGMHEVRDVQNIADILVDPEGALERRNHWEKTSHALLVGAILHVLYRCNGRRRKVARSGADNPGSRLRDDPRNFERGRCLVVVNSGARLRQRAPAHCLDLESGPHAASVGSMGRSRAQCAS
jgi:hypothetical protein